MKHLHRKVSHKIKKHPYIVSSFILFFVLVVTFYITRGKTPYTSELSIVDYSSLGKNAGSVVPASGESCPSGWCPETYPTYQVYQTYETYPPQTYETYQTYTPTPETYQTYTPTPETYQTYTPTPETYQTYSNNSYETYQGYNSYESYPSYPTYAGPATISYFNIAPRSVTQGGLITINWTIYHPTTGTNACKITAEVQKPASCDTACQSSRNTAQTALNTTLSSGTTNANDPYGANRVMSTALTQANANTGEYAKGRKSVTLDYSTTFTLSCGTQTTPFKSIIYVTDKNEG